MEKKRRFKLNKVDIVILAIILLAAGAFVWQYAFDGLFSPAEPEPSPDEEVPFREVVMTFSNYEITDDTFKDGRLKVGDTLVDRPTGVELGVITNMQVLPARSVGQDAEGQFVPASMPYRSHIILTVEGVARNPKEGGLRIENWHGYVNIDYQLNIGDAAFFLRLFDFELGEIVEIEEEDE
jgi:hypothetical protein